MEKIEKEVQRLDAQIVGVQKSIEQLKSLLSQNEDIDFDINYIEKSASGNAFIQHILSGIEHEIGYMYCCALASVADLSDDKIKKIKQLYYMFRIYHSSYRNMIAEEIIRDSKLFSVDNWKIVFDALNSEQKQNLFVDMLLMINLEGNAEQKQMEYFCELTAFSGYKTADIEIVSKIVKEILLINETGLFNLAKVRNINNYISYLGKKQRYYIVSSLDNMAGINKREILIYGDRIKDKKNILNIDKYGKTEIIFRNCHFENIAGFKNMTTKVQFIDCKFVDCKQENLNPDGCWKRYKDNGGQLFWLNMQNTQFERVIFENCTVEGYQNKSSVLKLKNSELRNCTFIGCKIGIFDHSGVNGTVLAINNTKLENCEFIDCCAYGESDYGSYNHFFMRIVEAMGGSVLGNLFKNCNCDTENASNKTLKNYILVYDNSCREKDNVFKSCETSQCQWSSDYKHLMKALIDIQ